MSGEQSYERGEHYFANGQVRSVTEDKGRLSATVQGAQAYRVGLWVEGSDVEYSCTCPMGRDGAFCKHCVAAGLSWLHESSGQPAAQKLRQLVRVRFFLAHEYHRLNRHDEAMSIIWVEFAESPELERYRVLKEHAARIGSWNVWREKAIAFIRKSMAAARSDAQPDRSIWSRRTDRSELVRILLWERKADAAWREAMEGGCSNDLWLALATKRMKEHPKDALPIYQRQIEPTLNRKNNQAYREAIGLLRQIRDLMFRVGNEPDFERYLASVRSGHKAKRNFVKLLDHATWT